MKWHIYIIIGCLILASIIALGFIITGGKSTMLKYFLSNPEEAGGFSLSGITLGNMTGFNPYYYSGKYSVYITGNESKWVDKVLVKDNQVIVYPKELKDRIYEECLRYDGDKCIETKNITYYVPSELPVDDGKTAKPSIPKTTDPKTAKDVFIYNLSGERFLKLGAGTIFVLEDMYLHTTGVENVTIEEAGFTHLNASNGNSNAYYSFDMNTTVVQDYFPYEYDMVITNTPIWTANGKYGGAYIFNNTQVLEDETYPAPGSNNVSISAWFKTPGGLGTTRGIFARVGGGDTLQLEVNATGGVVLQFIPSTAVQCTKTSYDYRDNAWHMATGVRFNATGAMLYVDGAYVCTIYTAPSTTLSAPGILVGMVSATAQGFNGSIDEVMVFNRSLSAAEITNIYNGNFQRFNKAGVEKFAISLGDGVGYNMINISSQINNLLDANISLMVEYFDTEFHTSPEFYNITNLKNYTFTISTEATSINLTYTFKSNKGFYSPEHYGTIYFETFNVTVEEADTTPPIINLDAPANNTNLTTQTVYFSANFTDDYNVSSATLWVWNINSTIINNTQFRNISGTEYGLNLSVILPYYTNYYWNYYACDNSSNCAWNSTNWSVGYAPVPDTTKPIINITYPINKTYGINVTILNYTMAETYPDSCWYSYNLGVTNSTETTAGTNFTISLNEGQTVLFLYCNDTSNNLGFNSTTLVQDTKPPYFTAIENITIQRNESVVYDINATDSGVGLDCFIVNDTNFNINCTGWLTNSTGLTVNTTYWLNISVNDTLNNWNSSIIYVNVTELPSIPDITPPYFNPIPQNTSVVYLTDTIILINATDNGINNTGIDCYTVNDTRFSINCTGGLINVTSLGVMRYWLNVSVNDTSNNWNSTYFYIDILQLGQFITPELNGINSNLIVTYPTQMNATHTGTNKTALKIEINGTAIKEGINYTIGAGFWIINWSAPENQNYSAVEESLNITVNQATGQADAYVNQSQIQFNATFGTTANDTYLNGTLTIGSGIINLSLNGVTINTGDSPLYNISNLSSGYYNLSAVYDGNQNYTSSISTIWINVSEIVIETTPPAFTNCRNFTVYVNYSFSQSITATDASGIDNYWLNQTETFNVTFNSGLIINITELKEPILYWLNLSVNDTLNNIASCYFWINTTEKPFAPPSNITAVSTPGCRYKKYGYYNKYLPWFKQENCL